MNDAAGKLLREGAVKQRNQFFDSCADRKFFGYDDHARQWLTSGEAFVGIFGHRVDIVREHYPIVQGGPIQHIRVFALVDFSLLRQQAIERR